MCEVVLLVVREREKERKKSKRGRKEQQQARSDERKISGIKGKDTEKGLRSTL